MSSGSICHSDLEMQFQCYIDNLFLDISCVFIYMDDILLFFKNEAQHIHDLNSVLKFLKITIFFLPLRLILFLGFSLSDAVINPSANKVDSISNFPEPTHEKVTY